MRMAEAIVMPNPAGFDEPGGGCGQYAAGTPGPVRKSKKRSGRAPDGGGKADQCGTDKNHRDFVAHDRDRHPDVLNGDRGWAWIRFGRSGGHRCGGQRTAREYDGSQILTHHLTPHVLRNIKADATRNGEEFGIALPTFLHSGPKVVLLRYDS
jgi:hypothetical protein